MQFCAQHAKDLDNAFASLSLNHSPSASSDSARNPPVASLVPGASQSLIPLPPKRTSSSPTEGVTSATLPTPPQASNELSIILLSLRKLREALLASASASSAPSTVFSQRVHVFSIRLAILAFHPPSYYPPLLHLLFVLHTPQDPLPTTELTEMTVYLILDLACRQGEMASAYSLRSSNKLKWNLRSRIADSVLAAIATSNWVAFWRVRRRVDGYVRAVMQWHVENLRKTTLKAFGRAYMGSDVNWVLASATGMEMTWDELVDRENVGWIRDGSKIVIRKPKVKGVT